jgi:DNA polymerase III delta prime subunit
MSRRKKNEEENKSIQYSLYGDTFVRCGSTVKTLEPGFYDVTNLGMAGYGLTPKNAVSDTLIDIPGTIADDIFVDIDKFLQTKDSYSEYGLTHKRGYLFYGPPGSGKTSLGMMLANRFINRVGGIVMYCGDSGAFYNGVSIMRDVEPGRPSMYLIEEADMIINNTHCLSILDGELSIQGAVFVAMTNYKEKLPPRIANRPGRFDRVEMVDCPPIAVQLEYLRRVEARGGKNPDAPERIVQALVGIPISMAHLREAFISHVLMGMSLTSVRSRFETMAGMKLSGELPDPVVDDTTDDEDDDWRKKERLENSAFWSPDSEE